MSLFLLCFISIIIIIFLYYLRLYIKGGVCRIKHSMKGKLIIITGASSSLGLWSSLDLIDSGAKVIFSYRSESKAKNSINLIKNELKKMKNIYI